MTVPLTAATRLVAAALVAGAVLAASPAHARSDIAVDRPYAVATPPGATTGAGYVEALSNHGAADDRLVGVSSPVADRVEVHTMSMDGDVMRMRAVPALVIPAGGHVDLAPGDGYHLMLIGLKRPLKVGDRVPLTLTFANAGHVDVEMPVRERGAARSQPMR